MFICSLNDASISVFHIIPQLLRYVRGWAIYAVVVVVVA